MQSGSELPLSSAAAVQSLSRHAQAGKMSNGIHTQTTVNIHDAATTPYFEEDLARVK